MTLVPLLLAAVVTLELCVVLDMPLNFANIIALPLLLGVGVAFKIYYIMAWRRGKTALVQSTLTRAVIFSALATATAFGSLWLSSDPGTSSMGKLMALALVCTMAAAVLFQPALMGPPRKIAADDGAAARRRGFAEEARTSSSRSGRARGAPSGTPSINANTRRCPDETRRASDAAATRPAPPTGRAMPRTSVAIDNLRAIVILLVLSFHSVLAYLAFLPHHPFAFDAPPYPVARLPDRRQQRWFGFDLFCAWQDVFLMSFFIFCRGCSSGRA